MPTAYELSLHLFDYDQQTPLDIEEVAVEHRDGVTVHDISYASPEGGRVPAYLVVPDGSGPFAGIILQHGCCGEGGESLRGQLVPEAVSLARTGAVALLIDAPFARPENTNRLPITLTEQDRDDQIQLIVDLRRGVDLLASREDVDATRIAYLGSSYSAAIGGLLAGVEKRIKAYVLAVGSGGLVEQFCDTTRKPYFCEDFPGRPLGRVSWSPDGSKIAFIVKREGSHDIYVINADGTNETRITEGSGLSMRPAWSPDGSKIAFDSYRDGGYEIYVIDADGSRQVRLANIGGDSGRPAWSPDGSKIAFDSDRDGDYEIYVMNVDGSDLIQLTDNTSDDFYPTWSPDERYIAFMSMRDHEENRDGNIEVYVVQADGTGQTNITNTPDADDCCPAWSPDGRHIAFASNRDGNIEVYVVQADGTEQTNITNTPDADDCCPAWSPDGSRIAFHESVGDIYVMDSDGSNRVRLRVESADGELRQERWLKAMEPIEPIHFVGHAAPAALFFQNARHDEGIQEEDALRYQQAGSEPKRVRWYDSGHRLPAEAIRDRVEWLQSQIGIDAKSFQ